MSSKTDLVTFIFCLIILFLILSFLEIRAERRQKSISVELSFAMVFTVKRPVSAAYVNVPLTTAWYIWVFVLWVTSQSHKMPFNFVIASRPLLILSLTSGSPFPSLAILAPKYLIYSYTIKTQNWFDVINKKKWYIRRPGSDSFLPSLSQLCYNWWSDIKTLSQVRFISRSYTEPVCVPSRPQKCSILCSDINPYPTNVENMVSSYQC